MLSSSPTFPAFSHLTFLTYTFLIFNKINFVDSTDNRLDSIRNKLNLIVKGFCVSSLYAKIFTDRKCWFQKRFAYIYFTSDVFLALINKISLPTLIVRTQILTKVMITYILVWNSSGNTQQAMSTEHTSLVSPELENYGTFILTISKYTLAYAHI